MKSVIERADALAEDMAQKWDRAVLEGGRPTVFFLCSEDVQVLQAVHLPDYQPVAGFRQTPVVSVGKREYAWLGWVLVAREEDREEMERAFAERGYTCEFAPVKPGVLWLLAEEGGEIGRSD